VTQAEGVGPVSVAGKKTDREPKDLTTQKKTTGGDKTDTDPPEPRSHEKGQASSSDGSSQSEPEFKKHDHAQYVKTIKNKAIDELNKHPNSTQAIFCTDRVTERRSLTIYFKRQKSYSFTYYEWDDVDQEMKQIFSAEKVPISRWKEHLQYADQDKECSTLKGEDLR
jgi:L-rhamnose mutarotase